MYTETHTSTTEAEIPIEEIYIINGHFQESFWSIFLGLDSFHKSLRPCALNESSFSIGRVKRFLL